jgi:hypothetical protein
MEKFTIYYLTYNKMANQFTSPREYKYIDGVLYQKCNTCWRWLTKDCFIKNNGAKFWIKTRCRDCHKPIQRRFHQDWYEKNKEYIKESSREYHKLNIDERTKVKNEHDTKFQNEHGFKWDKFHSKTRYFVKIHKLKPTACTICWRIWKVEIHHPSYETFDKWSSVVFCCHYCHSAIHDGYIECPKPINLLDLDKSINC